MRFTFPLFFYSVSGGSGREYAAQVVTMFEAGSVELRLEARGRDVGLRSEACSPNSLWAAARPRSVGPWTGEASYSRSSPCRRLTASF